MPTVNVNGYDLYYQDDDFVEPWQTHDAVFMQHYILGSGAEFQAWVPTLASEFRVIRLDRRGSGHSDKPGLDYQYKLDDIISDFVGALDALAIEKVHFIGQSLGGMLGAVFAATYPERVKSLVLCATPCFINNAVKADFAHEGYQDAPSAVMEMGSWAWAHAQFLRNRHAKATLTSDLSALHRAQQTALMPAHVIASLMRMVGEEDFNIMPYLRHIKTPTLLLSPEASHSTSLEEQAMMKDTITGCEQVVFEGARHGITWSQPRRCAEESLGFIRRYSNRC